VRCGGEQLVGRGKFGAAAAAAAASPWLLLTVAQFSAHCW
jgi:hypothetical protein